MRRNLHFAIAVCVLFTLSGCDCGSSGEPDSGDPISDGDAGQTFDAGSIIDAGSAGDAGTADAGPVDAGSGDAGPDDAGPDDAGPGDAGPGDAGPGDAGVGTFELEGVGVDDQGNVIVFWLDGGSRLVASWVDAGATGTFVAPRWQPRGDTIAFADGQFAWLARPDGGVERLDTPITASSDFQGLVARVEWSPDGTRLALEGLDYTTDNDAVFLLPSDGGLEPELIGVADEWAWMPEGGELLYTDYVPSISAYQTWAKSSPAATPVVRAPGRFLDVSAAGVLAYQIQRVYPDGGYGFSQLALAPDGGAANLLPDDTLSVSNFGGAGARWSPNGTELAIGGDVIRGVANVGFQVLVASQGAVRHTLYDQPSAGQGTPMCLRYTPTGRLTFVISNGTTGELHVVDEDGGVHLAGAPPLSAAAFRGCLDWRLRAVP